MMKERKYRLPEGLEPDIFLKELQHQFGLKTVSTNSTHHQYLDSFDWRLFKKGWILDSDGRGLQLYRADEAHTSNYLQVEQSVSFAGDLPESDLKKKIEPLLEMRRLLPQANIYITSKELRVLNEDEKTVVHLALQKVQTPSDPDTEPRLTYYLVMQPVRGYDKEAARLVNDIKAAGGTGVMADELFHLAMSAATKIPGDYDAKPTLLLEPSMPADEAIRQILLSDLSVMQINEPYIVQDLDTEFLHDYRVALRRSRSALDQMNGVFREEDTIYFKTALKQLNQMTNELRDLDVYLLAEAEYRAMIPDSLQEDIDPLFGYLHKKRMAMVQKTVKALKSETYRKMMCEWEQFLSDPGTGENAPEANRAILDLASERIYQRYRHILKNGRQILKHEEDEQMHTLRIECKKLRYLMEFFTTLYAQEQIATLISQLKKLQTNLGDFNDLWVQEDYLLTIADELPGYKGKSRRALLAVGALVTRLHEERLGVKAEFAATFKAFSAPANRKLSKKLFKKKVRMHS